MNEDMERIQRIIQEMKQLVEALERISDELPNDPKFHAATAEGPLAQLIQKRNEVDQLFDQFKPPSLRSTEVG